MDKAAMVKEYLVENEIAASCSTETVYRYHAALEAGCRLTGCEIVMRAAGEDVIVKAELPISVMTKETRGVVRFLADVNKKRAEEEKRGYFDLDYIAGKILFGMIVRKAESAAELHEIAEYCINEVEALSDELLKVVCAEHEAVLRAEEVLRRQQERESRGPGMLAKLMNRLSAAIREKLDAKKQEPPMLGAPEAEPAPVEAEQTENVPAQEADEPVVSAALNEEAEACGQEETAEESVCVQDEAEEMAAVDADEAPEQDGASESDKADDGAQPGEPAEEE